MLVINLLIQALLGLDKLSVRVMENYRYTETAWFTS
jgi:hypothetical protein